MKKIEPLATNPKADKINSVPRPEGKKGTKMKAETKADLIAERDKYKAMVEAQGSNSGQINIDGLTVGIFTALEVVTEIPFTEIDPKSKKAFDDAASSCMVAYGVDVAGKYLPAIQLSLAATALTLEAMSKRKPKTKKAAVSQIAADREKADETA